MCTEIRIYFEGDRSLKPGFDAFFAEIKNRAGKRHCNFHLIAGSSGETACRYFGLALGTTPDAWNILLRDSEGPADANSSAALCNRHGWDESHADSIFWMVEMMEAWFHADRGALRKFYGAAFKENALAKNPKVEQIPKKDLEEGLSEATKNTGKGDYSDNKTSHGPALLGKLDPELVRKAAPNCQRLFEAVLTRLA
jgi:Domain of unknown function (DUF4276)